MPEFQQSKSEFAEIVKYLIKEVAAHITHLEDHMLMLPAKSDEQHSQRDAFRDFRRAFRDLYLLTFNTVRNKDLLVAVDLWFTHPYRTENKDHVFGVGIDFARQYITEMYSLGLLDLNVSIPVDFPFEDMIRDIQAERTRLDVMKMDISLPNADGQNGASNNKPGPSHSGNDSDDPMDIESLVDMTEPDVEEDESDGFNMFDPNSPLMVDYVEDINEE